MSLAFTKALAFTLGPSVEGGLVDNPLDRGGRTNHGVTQALFDAWRAQHQLAAKQVDLITDEEERTLYFEEFWVPCRCEELPAGVGAAVFDMAVNSGTWNAKLTLQEAVHVQADGQLGPATMLAASNAQHLVLEFLKHRGAFYRDIVADRPAQVAFLSGWINRLLDFQDHYFAGGFA